MTSHVGDNFVALTQSLDVSMSNTEMQMCWSRYSWLRRFAENADVLEVGSGQGLARDYLSRTAKSYVQVDFSISNLARSRKGNELPVVCASGDCLPIIDKSFEVVAALEMIYYLPDVPKFLAEAQRVLTPDGILFLTMPNPERRGFHRSPYSTTYPTVEQLRILLRNAGFDAEIYMAFAMSQTVSSRCLHACFSLVERLHLVPRSLKGRARLKRFIQGRTSGFPGMEELEQRFASQGDQVERGVVSDMGSWSLIYAVARPRS
jgi:SAM-dependent methyltransferase